MNAAAYHNDYPHEPIGGDNPYHRCAHCKVSDPQINGRLEGHAPGCPYRIEKERLTMTNLTCEQAAQTLGIPLLALGQLMAEGRLAPHSGMTFDACEVTRLKTDHPEWLTRLREG